MITARRKQDFIFFTPTGRKRRRGCLLYVFLIALAITGLLVSMNLASSNQLTLAAERVPIMNLDKAIEGFKILHISDLNANRLGRSDARWRSLLKTKTYHAVCLTGDMVGPSGDSAPLVSLIGTLRAINPDAPIFLIAGDSDPEPVLYTPHGDTEVLAAWIRDAQAAGAIYLDAPMSVTIGKRKVWFSPADAYTLDAEGMASSLAREIKRMEEGSDPFLSDGATAYRAARYRLDAMNRTVAARAEIDDADAQVALTHVPLDAAYVRETQNMQGTAARSMNYRKLGLVLAGHYCAGQWRLPSGGAIYVPDLGFLPSDDGIVGMGRVNSLNQYVSAGVGSSALYPFFPGRMFNTPTITILTLTARPV